PGDVDLTITAIDGDGRASKSSAVRVQATPDRNAEPSRCRADLKGCGLGATVGYVFGVFLTFGVLLGGLVLAVARTVRRPRGSGELLAPRVGQYIAYTAMVKELGWITVGLVGVIVALWSDAMFIAMVPGTVVGLGLIDGYIARQALRRLD